jgi:hypothetical protein
MKMAIKWNGIFKGVLLLLFFVACQDMHAQEPDKVYTVKNGNMYIRLSKNIKLSELDEFISRFDLGELALKKFFLQGFEDSLKLAGWKIEKNTREELVILKPLFASEDVLSPGERIIFMGDHPSFNAIFPTVSNSVVFGYNRFRNKQPFYIHDSVARFYLENNKNASRVMLAGSFNNWNPADLPMTKTDSGWIADIKLTPGKYWYKFIIDGKWVIDQDNLLSENDGLGNTNSVFYFTNTVFRLHGFEQAKKVYVSGSFNKWNEKQLDMRKVAGGWELPLYLAEGTHTYRFIVDKQWITDPANPEQLPNEFNQANSVIRIGKPYLFKLAGYEDATNVVLTGSFNGWRDDELFMHKTGNGWELPYVIGPGNYEYKFIADKKYIRDPAAEKNSKGNSLLIIDPNYTFRLKGYEHANTVLLAGDFNNWDPAVLPMKNQNGEWVINVHLSPGKHLYKFIVDGKWIMDPANELFEQNEHNTGNSILWFEEPKKI